MMRVRYGLTWIMFFSLGGSWERAMRKHQMHGPFIILEWWKYRAENSKRTRTIRFYIWIYDVNCQQGRIISCCVSHCFCFYFFTYVKGLVEIVTPCMTKKDKNNNNSTTRTTVIHASLQRKSFSNKLLLSRWNCYQFEFENYFDSTFSGCNC